VVREEFWGEFGCRGQGARRMLGGPGLEWVGGGSFRYGIGALRWSCGLGGAVIGVVARVRVGGLWYGGGWGWSDVYRGRVGAFF